MSLPATLTAESAPWFPHQPADVAIAGDFLCELDLSVPADLPRVPGGALGDTLGSALNGIGSAASYTRPVAFFAWISEAIEGAPVVDALAADASTDESAAIPHAECDAWATPSPNPSPHSGFGTQPPAETDLAEVLSSPPAAAEEGLADNQWHRSDSSQQPGRSEIPDRSAASGAPPSLAAASLRANREAPQPATEMETRVRMPAPIAFAARLTQARTQSPGPVAEAVTPAQAEGCAAGDKPQPAPLSSQNQPTSSPEDRSAPASQTSLPKADRPAATRPTAERCEAAGNRTVSAVDGEPPRRDAAAASADRAAQIGKEVYRTSAPRSTESQSAEPKLMDSQRMDRPPVLPGAESRGSRAAAAGRTGQAPPQHAESGPEEPGVARLPDKSPARVFWGALPNQNAISGSAIQPRNAHRTFAASLANTGSPSESGPSARAETARQHDAPLTANSKQLTETETASAPGSRKQAPAHPESRDTRQDHRQGGRGILDVPVHRHAAGTEPATRNSGTGEASATPRQPATEPLRQISTLEEASQASHTSRRIELRLGGPGPEGVNVAVSDRAGSIRVAVRTADRDLTTSLRERLSDLVSRLDVAGFRTQTWHPQSGAALGRSSDETGSGGRHSGGDTGSGAGQQHSRQSDQHDEQDGREAPAWYSELESSGLPGILEAKERDVWTQLLRR